MKLDRFLKQVLSEEMPKDEDVIKHCLDDSYVRIRNRKSRQKLVFAVACVIATCVVLFSPVRAMAGSLFHNLMVTLKMNGYILPLGSGNFYKIHIPDDCEEVKIEGNQYLTKQYQSVSELKEDICVEILNWKEAKRYIDVLLAIKNEDYARVSVIYEMPEGKESAGGEDKEDVIDMIMHAYIPLKEDTSIWDCKLDDKQLEYATIDERGGIITYKQSEKYEFVEQYYDEKLRTDVTVIEDKTNTVTNEQNHFVHNGQYYFYFTKNGILYQIQISGNIKKAKLIVEDFVEDNCTSTEFRKSQFPVDANLIEEAIVGETIYLGRGDKIKIRAEKGSYENVCIVGVSGKSYDIGNLIQNDTVTIEIQAEGTYAIYSKKDSIQNITREISIEIEKNENQKILAQRKTIH